MIFLQLSDCSLFPFEIRYPAKHSQHPKNSSIQTLSKRLVLLSDLSESPYRPRLLVMSDWLYCTPLNNLAYPIVLTAHHANMHYDLQPF